MSRVILKHTEVITEMSFGSIKAGRFLPSANLLDMFILKPLLSASGRLYSTDMPSCSH